MKRWPIVALLLLVCAGDAIAASPCRLGALPQTEFGSHVGWERTLAPGGAIELPALGNIRYLRILLESIAPNDAIWDVVIRDSSYRPIQSISSRELRSGQLMWSRRLPTSTIDIRQTAGTPAGPTIRTRQYVKMLSDTARPPYYSLRDPSQAPTWTDLYGASPIHDKPVKRRGESVGMFISADPRSIGEAPVWSCTGFVVATAPDLLFVTNHHCGNLAGAAATWPAAVCQNGRVDLSWDGDGIDREYECESVVALSSENDIAVLRLRGAAGGLTPLPLRRSRHTADTEIHIIHHPAALSKRVSKGPGCIARLARPDSPETVDRDRDFTHECDTEGGSSGAPVFNANGQVIGIHHSGHALQTSGNCDKLNKATHVDRLIALMTAKGLRGYVTTD